MRHIRLVILFIVCSFPFEHLQAQKKHSAPNDEKTVTLQGRTLAFVNSLTTGAGVGPSYEKFIFAVETNNISKSKSFYPLKIVYQYFNSRDSLKNEFFDYTKFYELKLIRDVRCDESVKSISFVKNVAENGEKLPPSYNLQFSERSPKINLDLELILPCYILRENNYHIIN